MFNLRYGLYAKDLSCFFSFGASGLRGSEDVRVNIEGVEGGGTGFCNVKSSKTLGFRV